MDNLHLEKTLKERQDKILNFFKKKTEWVAYVCLAFVVFIALWIRTRNLYGLRDTTTGGWALGPDLDPYLFLRWAKYIVENGTLFAIDTMRYVPVNFETKAELLFLPYLMAWFHKIAAVFGSGSVEQSSALFPVAIFGVTVVAFFFFVRSLFIRTLSPLKSDSIALVSSFFLSVIPALLPRTIAGIPEKESAAFLFMFLAFFFFNESWNSSNKHKRYLLAILSGFSTAGMALIWGGFAYIFYVIGSALVISYFLHSFTNQKAFLTLTWMISAFAIMIPFSTRYPLMGLLKSTMTIPILAVLAALFVEKNLLKKISSEGYFWKGYRIPKKALSFGIIIIAGILLLSILDFGFIGKTWGSVRQILVEPIVDRFGVTVAENRQPYFGEWTSNFGPMLNVGKSSMALGFWLMLVGASVIFYNFIAKGSLKSKYIFTGAFFAMFIAIAINRYTPESIFNGTNFISLVVYFGSLIGFTILSFRILNKKNEDELKGIKFDFILLMSAFAFGFVAARSSVRTTMVLVPVASIMVGYLTVVSLIKIKKGIYSKEFSIAFAIAGLLLIASLFSAYNLFYSSESLGSNYVPSAYNQQWQKAMHWVRENTSEQAVFAHWWDYGYWVQSIGKRATVLDGGNAIVYWDYLMGRHGLTATNQKDTLEFFYAHNVTNFLIDPTDIGKYGAFSSIGSDVNYDRRSWIPTLLKDPSQTVERKNSTIVFYPGGASLDKDISYDMNGTKLFLPEGNAYVAGIGVVIDKNDKIIDLFGVYWMQEKTYQIPLRYYFDKNEGFVDTGKGIEAGVFIYPRAQLDSSGGGQIDPRGALLYLSPKTVKTNLARFYLYGEENDNFKLAHSEPDFLVEFLNAQNPAIGDFVFYNEFRGPIKIWEISYPKNVEFKKEYNELIYPEFLARV